MACEATTLASVAAARRRTRDSVQASAVQASWPARTSRSRPAERTPWVRRTRHRPGDTAQQHRAGLTVRARPLTSPDTTKDKVSYTLHGSAAAGVTAPVGDAQDQAYCAPSADWIRSTCPTTRARECTHGGPPAAIQLAVMLTCILLFFPFPFPFPCPFLLHLYITRPPGPKHPRSQVTETALQAFRLLPAGDSVTRLPDPKRLSLQEWLHTHLIPCKHCAREPLAL